MNLKDFDKIFCLVSGGIDSTYLYEKLKKSYGDKVYPVNCFNPFETSITLSEISKDPNFIQIKPHFNIDNEPHTGISLIKKGYITKNGNFDYGKIIKDAFLKLPEARKLKAQGKYHKKIFPCCYYIKHKAFLNDAQFKEENTVVISGIKRGDGTQRRIWLTQLGNGNEPCNQSEGEPTFFHKHKGGQMYCYPFRDYKWRELPEICIRRLRKKYPMLDHSGCEICTVLVLFPKSCTSDNDKRRLKKSLEYASKLGVLDQELITKKRWGKDEGD